MNGEKDQPRDSVRLSPDERRLILLRRCLTRLRRDEVGRGLLSEAIERCLPFRSIHDFRPNQVGDFHLDWDAAWDDSTAAAQLQAALNEKVGDMGDYIEASVGEFDKDVAEQAAKLTQQWCDEGRRSAYLTASDIQGFLGDWRDAIADACDRVRSGIATTVEEANAQKLVVPERFEGWVSFALTLDGHAICEELDYPEPGQHDVLFDLTQPELTVLDVRLSLYLKLRFMQRHGRDAGDVTAEERRDITEALEWLRRKLEKGQS